MEYYFNELDAVTFQRLINGILVTRFGEHIRLTPLRGADGGRDAETAPDDPYFAFQVDIPSNSSTPVGWREGRYLFQVKHHRTTNTRLSDARSSVLTDFEDELKRNVLNRKDNEQVNFFYLITNVPSSRASLKKLDEKRKELIIGHKLHADIWWEERLFAYLDQMPTLWKTFPQLFAGGVPPLLADVASQTTKALPRAIRLALEKQYQRESNVKFRQIELERSLSKLFVDLDVSIQHLSPENQHNFATAVMRRQREVLEEDDANHEEVRPYAMRRSTSLVSALSILLDENNEVTRKFILEGGPGQGKSTITQMAAQIYRQQLLGKTEIKIKAAWFPPSKSRLPFRIELKNFAEWLNDNADASVEEFLAHTIKRDSGGSNVSPDDIHNVVEGAPVILLFDGLDEVGSDDLRDTVLMRIAECVERFESNLRCDLRVIVTTRPPAIAGRRDRLINFARFPIVPLETNRIRNYINRWLSVQIPDIEEQEELRKSFVQRQNEPHVKALIKNPMQLSVLLHFIRLKGVAFPDRRAELYREYFRIVIERDVEKSTDLRKNQDIIVALHQLLGYKIHALTEVEQSDGTLSRYHLLEIVETWLKARGNESLTAQKLFKLGEERLGLIVSLKGEGGEAHYGYDVQPIREYFAAAFINDQIKGNAHEVFQAMVRRSFWREVALFLAGLRRPNEKADLIARAKELDKDADLGWRQDGRAIILQLAQEGVFSEPQHVFADANDFLIDSLDARMVRVQNEPKELVEAIPILVKQGESKAHIERLLRLLNDFRDSQDERVLYRLLRVASQLLEPEKLRQQLLTYTEQPAELLTKIRLVYPYSWGINMKKATASSLYWKDIPAEVWARSLWKAAMQSDLVTVLSLPPIYHKFLVERFATDPISISIEGYKSLEHLQSSPAKLAAWRLLTYHKLLHFSAIAEDPKRSTVIDEYPAYFKKLQNDSNVEFAGLSKTIEHTLRDLLTISKQILAAMRVSMTQAEEALASYIPTLLKNLSRPGLASLITCRWATNILRTFIASSFRLSTHSRDHVLKKLKEAPDADLFINTLRSFYENAPAKTGGSSTDVMNDFGFMFSDFRAASNEVTPIMVRVKAGDKLTPLTDLFAANVNGTAKLPFDWMSRMPLTSDLIRPLVDKCRPNITALLKMLGKAHFSFISSDALLPHRDIKLILKAARSTEDRTVLTGALIALSPSKFVSTAGTDLLLKLLRVDSGHAKDAARIFGQWRFDITFDFFVGTKEDNSKEIAATIEVAQRVLELPNEFAFEVVTAAASYLAEHKQVNLPSLQADEHRLDIRVG